MGILLRRHSRLNMMLRTDLASTPVTYSFVPFSSQSAIHHLRRCHRALHQSHHAQACLFQLPSSYSACHDKLTLNRPRLGISKTAKQTRARASRSDVDELLYGESTAAATRTYLPEDYICEGPLLSPCSINTEQVKHDFRRWLELADTVAKDLGLDIDELDDAARMRIFQYYLPVFFWCWERVKQHQNDDSSGRPLVIGMQAVQGCGKTTLVTELENLFEKVGLRAASVSVDDFYLPFEGQQELIKEYPDNFLLGVRGNALTHDLDLGRETLQALLQLGQGSSTAIKVPRYDKSAYDGRGDRADQSAWPSIQAPVDVVLFEGWMLGFSPVSDAAAAQVSQDLVPINQRLADYVSQWDSLVDAWLVIKVADPAYVFRWRQQAEHAMKAAGRSGMTDEQVQDFVNRYMPAYHAYLPGMYEKGPSTGREHNVLMFEIDESRGLSASKAPASVAALDK